jgi:uncharacterized protein (TIGR02996 family)
MMVHFVYRNQQGPTGLQHRQFPDATVLDWFARHWEAIPDWETANQRAKELLACRVYTFERLFEGIAEHGLRPPRSAGRLREALSKARLYINEMRIGEHCVQVLTDDDETELAWYFVDDVYLAKHGKRAAYLLRDDWRLPAEAGEGGFRPAVKVTRLDKVRGQGATYMVFHDFWDSGNLDDLEGGYRIDGIRLPELARWLADNDVPRWGCCLSHDLPALKQGLLAKVEKARTEEEALLQALAEAPEDDGAWRALHDWLQDRGGKSAGAYLLERGLRGVTRMQVGNYTSWKFAPDKSRVQVDEHVAVLCRHVNQWNAYHQWYLFDDLWASAQPDLANAILRYAARWDVL